MLRPGFPACWISGEASITDLSSHLTEDIIKSDLGPYNLPKKVSLGSVLLILLPATAWWVIEKLA